MKLLKTICPHCGAPLEYDAEQKKAVCGFCKSELIVDDEVQHLSFDNGEEFGYQFEKGRQRAQAEMKSNTAKQTAGTQIPAVSVTLSAPKRKTWLWVLGWIFIFPLPLTLILIKKPNMPNINKTLKYVIIIFAWLAYIGMMGISAVSDSKESKKATETSVSENATEQTSTESD